MATINGTAGVDILNGTVASDQIFGLDGNDTLNGLAGDDLLEGGNGNDTLNGDDGIDILDGGTGNDDMSGGNGNDTYIVDSTGDKITESKGGGRADLILSSISFNMDADGPDSGSQDDGKNVENLTLTGSANIDATGNSSANVLTGNSGNNVLNGLGRNDTLIGGAGDDTYIVQQTTDVVDEVSAGGAGTDTVQSSVNYTLSADVENITLTGTKNLKATGNADNNIITGNTGNNTLTGLAGDDTYVVQDTGDVVVEAASAGTDLILSSVTYTLSAEVENLTLTGTSNINATGNSLDNVITGNSGNNTLNGDTGADQLIGGSGNDILDYDAADTIIDGGSGNDILIISGSGVTLDLTAVNPIDHIEIFNLTGSGNNTLNLLEASIISISDNNIFRVNGNAGDAVIADGVWLNTGTTNISGVSYNVFTSGPATLQVQTTVNSLGVNQAPTAVNNSGAGFVTNEDTPFTTGDVLANDSDVNLNVLSVVAVDPVSVGGGLITDNGNGTFDYDPNGQFEFLPVGQNTTDTFTYTISDGRGGTDVATVTITITGVNDAPVAVDDVAAVNEDATTANLRLSLLSNDTDVDTGETATLAITAVTQGATGSVVLNNNGTPLNFNDDILTYTADGAVLDALAVGETATDTFTYTITDAQGATDTATVTVTITGVNDDPDAVDDTGAGFSTDEDSSFTTGDVLANDTDPDNGETATLTVIAVDATSVGGGLITDNGDGTFDYDPNGQFESLDTGETATDTFTYTIEDAQGATDTATVTITITGVNDAPVTTDDSATTDEDSSVNGTVVDNTTDVDDDVNTELTYSVVGATPAGLTFNADGTYSFNAAGLFDNLDTGDSTDITFDYTADDGEDTGNTSTVTITITGINDAPVTTDDSATTDEDSSVNGTVVDNTTDADDDVNTELTYSVVGATPAGLTFNADGTYSFDPTGMFDNLDTGDSTDITFDYTADDGEDTGNTSTVTVTITGVNDAPVTTDDSATTDEDSSVNGTVVDNTTDVDDDVNTELTYSVVGATPAGLTFNADGTYSFNAAGLFDNLDTGDSTDITFDYTADDGEDTGNTSTVTITITGINDAPVTTDDSATTDEDSSVNGTVVDNTTDADDDVNTELTYSVVGATPAGLTFNADGTYSFDPTGMFDNLDTGDSTDITFDYTADDGEDTGNTSTVTVTITGVNDAPVTTDDSATTDEDSSVNGTVVDNTTDVDDDVNTELTYSVVGATPAGLTFNADGTYSFNAAGLFDNLDTGDSTDITFDYTADDGEDTGNTSTVTITITGINDAPVTTDDSATTDEDSSVNGTVVDNTTDADDDVNTELTYSVVGATPAGLTFNADGTYSFDPTGMFDNLDTGDSTDITFDYTADDGEDTGNTSTVTVTITGVNDAPVTTDDSATTDEDSSVNGTVVDNTTDVDDDVNTELTYSVVGATPAGLTFNADGTYSFNAAGLFDNLDTGDSTDITFDYTADDGEDTGNTSTVTITITGINDAPVTTDDSATTDEDSSVNGTVVDNTTDADDDVNTELTYSVVGATPAGLTFNADGTYSFNAAGMFDNLDTGDSTDITFDYTADDGEDTGNTSTVTVTITGVNDAPVTTDDSATTDEDSSVNGTVVDNTTDVDDDVNTELTYSVVGATPAGLTFNADGTYSFNAAGLFDNLDTGDSTDITFDYTADDGEDTGNTSTVTITITGINDAPVTTDDSATTDEDSSVNGTVVDNTTDADDDVNTELTYSVVGATPAGLTFNADGTYSFNAAGMFDNLDTGDSTDITFDYTADDGEDTGNTSTVTVTITGVNDAPVTTDDSATTDEDSSVNGTVVDNTTDADDDVNTELTYSVVGATPAGLTFNADGTYSFDPTGMFDNLDTGDSTDITFDYTADDGEDTGNTSTVTITITGSNDAPVITVGAGDSAAETLAETNAGLTVSDTLTVVDPDLSDAVTAAVQGVVESGTTTGAPSNATLAAMLTVTAGSINADTGDTNNLGWTFNSGAQAFDYLDDGESLVLTYTVRATDDSTVFDDQTVTITITGSNDAPVITVGAGDSAAETLAETNAGLTVSDTLTVVDPDLSDAVTAAVQGVVESGTTTGAPSNATLAAMLTVTAGSINADTGDTNNLGWTFNSGAQAFDYLDDGESLVLTYTVRATDDSTVFDDQTVTITITGSNDAPVITVGAGDSAAETLAETNAGLTVSDTLTVVDPDLSDAVTAAVQGVVESGTTTGAPSNATLAAMLTVTAGSINADTGDTNNLGWTFNSGLEAFDYLDDGESLVLTYTVRATDDSTVFDDQTVTITITGSNDAPVITVGAGDSAAETLAETNAGLTVSDTLTVVDPDLSDAVTAAVQGVVESGTTTGAPSNATLAAMLTVTAGSINADTGDTNNLGWTFNSGLEAFDYLATGESLVLTYTVRATDDSAAFDDQTVTITIDGAVDTFDDTAGADSFTGTLGDDIFLFNDALGGDTINNYDAADDLIQLDNSVFIALATLGTLGVAEFESGAGLTAATAATAGSTRIAYDTGTGDIYYDADGAGGSDAVIFATLNSPAGVIANTEFEVV